MFPTYTLSLKQFPPLSFGAKYQKPHPVDSKVDELQLLIVEFHFAHVEFPIAFMSMQHEFGR